MKRGKVGRRAGSATTRRRGAGSAGRGRYWSAEVNRRSDSLDLEPGVFKMTSARAIAASLKRSADHSQRRKAGAYQSAMSMLNFYINRAGRSLSPTGRTRLERTKGELRTLFGSDGRRRPPRGARR